jgi:hypothetical protein
MYLHQYGAPCCSRSGAPPFVLVLALACVRTRLHIKGKKQSKHLTRSDEGSTSSPTQFGRYKKKNSDGGGGDGRRGTAREHETFFFPPKRFRELQLSF